MRVCGGRVADNLGVMAGPAFLGDRYEVRDVLGFGGMAEVRDGWDTRLNRAVAIKLLHPGLSSQADVRERFEIEARAAAALSHPSIVGVFDFGDHEGTPFIVMERLPGDTLGDQIAAGPLSGVQVYAALRNVVAALAAAHGAGMLHRDIKPSNILLASSGSVKVADFGIVKAPGSVHTTTGQLVGTLAYLSPNRIAGNPASVGDDLYAVGVVGYEALTGRKPFTQEDIAPLARAITQDQPPPLAGLRPDIDPELVETIERAMSRDPVRQFSSAEAMASALNRETSQPAVGRHMSMSSHQRPPTRIMNRQPYSSSTAFAVQPAVQGHRQTRARKVAGSAALLAAMAVAAIAFALDTPSATRPTAPEPVSTSTPVSMTAVPSPVVEPPPPPSPVAEQATQQQPRGNGKGGGNNGNGKGSGNGKPK